MHIVPIESNSDHLPACDSSAVSGSGVPAHTTSPGEVKHTPGPWTLHHEDKWPFGLWIESAGGSVVVEERRQAYSTEQKTLHQVMQGVHMGKDREEAARVNALQVANLRLIAAGPELLKGAQHLIAYEDAMNGDDHISAMSHYADAVDTLRAAVLKATGAPHAE